MSLGSRRAKTVLLIPAGGLLCVVLLCIVPEGARLENQSKKICPLPSSAFLGYDWLNNAELLWATSKGGSPRIYTLNTSNGSTSPLEIPTRALQESGTQLKGGWSFFGISPGKDQLLIRAINEQAESLLFVNVTNGSIRKETLADDEHYMCWLGDGSGIVKFARHGDHSEARIMHWDQTNQETIQLPISVRYPFLLRANDGLLMTGIERDRTTLEVSSTFLKTQATVLKKINFPVVGPADGLEPTFSPDGTRLCWVRWLPGGHFRGSRFSLVVANLGTGRTEEYRTTDLIGGLRWRPDSHAISYFSNGSIYLYKLKDD
jgi:hypothetical protein